MSPAAKTYLISGYPRSMRDVVEYSEKVSRSRQPLSLFNLLSLINLFFLLWHQIQVINGVVLISWRQAVLQRQIDYGAKLGHGEYLALVDVPRVFTELLFSEVVLSLAKMELDNFFKSVMPVADYFDQSDMLVAVSGTEIDFLVMKL